MKTSRLGRWISTETLLSDSWAMPMRWERLSELWLVWGKDTKDMNSRLTAKHLLSRFVRATYGVASAYVLADTVDKANKMNKVSYLPFNC